MPDPIPQTVPISELRRQQDKILKMAEAAPVVLMSRSEPAGVLVSPQEWNQIVNRLRQLEALQEARRNIAQNNAKQSWVSSAEIRERMTQIQFGFTMPADQLDKAQRTTFVADLNRALQLISGHFDSAWFIDHLQYGDADQLEGFTALAYMAALHPQLKFGHTVLCQSFRNPALLAKMAATLQFLSGGRFILGIGAGSMRRSTGPTAMSFRLLVCA